MAGMTTYRLQTDGAVIACWQRIIELAKIVDTKKAAYVYLYTMCLLQLICDVTVCLVGLTCC